MLCCVCRFEQIEVVDELKYLVKWSGLSYQFCTWETREEVCMHVCMYAYHLLAIVYLDTCAIQILVALSISPVIYVRSVFWVWLLFTAAVHYCSLSRYLCVSVHVSRVVPAASVPLRPYEPRRVRGLFVFLSARDSEMPPFGSLALSALLSVRPSCLLPLASGLFFFCVSEFGF